jgi:hypothetical protein
MQNMINFVQYDLATVSLTPTTVVISLNKNTGTVLWDKCIYATDLQVKK